MTTRAGRWPRRSPGKWTIPPSPCPIPELPAPEKHGEDKPKRSLVFKAIVVMAVLLLVGAAAAGAVRGLHHPGRRQPHRRPTSRPPHSLLRGPAFRVRVRRGRLRPAWPGSRQPPTPSTPPRPPPAWASRRCRRSPRRQTSRRLSTRTFRPYSSTRRSCREPRCRPPPSLRLPAPRRKSGRICSSSKTIDGLPPQQLGAFLTQFDTDTTQLQTTLSTLEQDLRKPAPRRPSGRLAWGLSNGCGGLHTRASLPLTRPLR